MPSGNLTRTAADSQLRSDAIALLRGYVPKPSDTNSLSDGIANNVESRYSFVDTNFLSDNATAQPFGTYSQTTADTIPLSDGFMQTSGLYFGISENLSLSDVLVSGESFVPILIDSYNLSDTNSASRSDTVSPADSVSLSDNQATSAIFQAALADLENLTDLISALQATTPAFCDLNSLLDSVSISLDELNQNLPLSVACSDEIPLEDEDIDDGDCMGMNFEVRLGYK